MKTNLISFSFQRGGAANAAANFARLAQQFGPTTCFAPEITTSSDLEIIGATRLESKLHFSKRVFCHFLLKLMRDQNPTKHSLNLFSSRIALKGIEDAIQNQKALNIHWFNNETLSINSLCTLPRSSVITMHDGWLINGTEHVRSILNETKIITKGIDWNEIQKRRKKRTFSTRKDIIITTPSRWLQKEAQNSEALGGNRVMLLPNPIDCNIFSPPTQDERNHFLSELGIPIDNTILSFGAFNSHNNPLKGSDKLEKAFHHLTNQLSRTKSRSISLLSFGGTKKQRYSIAGFQAIELGTLPNPKRVRLALGSSDVSIVASLSESFGQVAAESLACETPVVAFNNSGTTDIVRHAENGFLANPFSSQSLSENIARICEMDSLSRKNMGATGREHIKTHFSPDVIKEKYRKILEASLQERLTENAAYNFEN